MPERAKRRPTDADGYSEAWSILERLWGETVEQAPAGGAPRVGRRATAAWVGRMLLGDPDQWDFLPRDRAARSTLDEAPALRAQGWAMVAAVLADLTDDQLATKGLLHRAGWPLDEDVPFALCLDTVLDEE